MNELAGALRAFGIHLPDTAIAAVMQRLDLDQDGTVSFEEYCEFVGPYVASASTGQLSPQQLQELRAAFTVYDKDGSGEIDVKELREVLKQSGQHYNDEQIQAIIASADTDKSGALNFQEFVTLLTRKA